MKYYGGEGSCLILFESYLKWRKQRVVVKSQGLLQRIYSSWKRYKMWCSRRSILAPILFLLYMNDPSDKQHTCETDLIYANDTTAIIKHLIDLKQITQEMLNSMTRWFKVNSLWSFATAIYGILIRGISVGWNHILTMQKKILWIMTKWKKKKSCRR